MKRKVSFAGIGMLLVLLFAVPARAAEEQEEKEKEDEEQVEQVDEKEMPDSPSSAAAALEKWQKGNHKPVRNLPKRWLFMQSQPTAYGFPSPLVLDRSGFDNFGWFEAADPEGIRLYFQFNPKLKAEEFSAELLQQRLMTFMLLTYSDGLVLRHSEPGQDENSPVISWIFYSRTSKGLVELGRVEKGPESMRHNVLAKWLIEQLGYDAVAVGMSEGYIILAKLKPVKLRSQGLLMKSSSSSILLKDSKDVGALVRVVHEDPDYLVAKFLLSKSGKPKVPMGSRALFSD